MNKCPWNYNDCMYWASYLAGDDADNNNTTAADCDHFSCLFVFSVLVG